MNIEILEFYPLEHNEAKGFLSGTLRVSLPDSGLHILGVYVMKKKDFWLFRLPTNTGTHHETGEFVRFPCIVFEDSEKQRDLMTAIREKGRAFIERRLSDTENPLIFPQKQNHAAKQANPQVKQQNPKEGQPIAKKTASATSGDIIDSVEKNKPVQRHVDCSAISKREYVDLPPREKNIHKPTYAKLK